MDSSIIIGIIVSLVGAVGYYRYKANKNKVEAILAETKGRDKELKEQQKEVEESISELDRNIKKIKEDRQKERDKRAKQTREERANEWN